MWDKTRFKKSSGFLVHLVVSATLTTGYLSGMERHEADTIDAMAETVFEATGSMTLSGNPSHRSFTGKRS